MCADSLGKPSPYAVSAKVPLLTASPSLGQLDGHRPILAQLAIHTPCTEAFALPVGEELGAFDCGPGRTVEIDENGIPARLRALVVACLDPSQLPRLYELFAVRVELAHQLVVDLVERFVRLEIEFGPAVDHIVIRCGLSTIGPGGGSPQQDDTDQEVLIHGNSPLGKAVAGGARRHLASTVAIAAASLVCTAGCCNVTSSVRLTMMPASSSSAGCVAVLSTTRSSK